MKTFNLRVLHPGGTTLKESIIAEDFNSDGGFYEFYEGDETVACYPIAFTIIEDIKTHDEDGNFGFR